MIHRHRSHTCHGTAQKSGTCSQGKGPFAAAKETAGAPVVVVEDASARVSVITTAIAVSVAVIVGSTVNTSAIVEVRAATVGRTLSVDPTTASNPGKKVFRKGLVQSFNA